MKRTVINMESSTIDWNADTIVVTTNTEENLLWWSRKDTKANELYNRFLDHDYVLYMHKDQQSFFIKRKLVSTIWHRTDLTQVGDTFYTLQDPLKKNNLAENRLVVIFSSMPPENEYFSAQVAKRTFVQNYPSMPKHLIKNTYILRIMDLNRSSGSYYLNAGYYQNFEDDVQSIIQQVRTEKQIAQEKVVLYSSSKGGSGALYHSILGDYHAVVVDPIFSLEKYNKDRDLHSLEDVLPEKLLPKFQEAISKGNLKNKKLILGSSQVLENYQEYSKICDPMIQVVDIQDDNIKDHISVSPNCNVEQITFINSFLMGIGN
ncbi:hypothetical protein LFYK43_22190 [Ligilactobacillus salitolerans]|uniref:XcbB/CpsF family capsular polysaccharide biosynthesis protein n=1 Tax=Ligilactobacillus salitolerans TaxID=1808352 RepID=A0A401IW39_9LACO|nr:XcbB/CpsF family capsular polysaccharide biosynthesis protein [Ligilactobacillus salitolerans]GBG95760.1 hypothetical protein LFYK43_22190 [Ligilactobacillus salitolerans]